MDFEPLRSGKTTSGRGYIHIYPYPSVDMDMDTQHQNLVDMNTQRAPISIIISIGEP
jgi:hypothetical protein